MSTPLNYHDITDYLANWNSAMDIKMSYGVVSAWYEIVNNFLSIFE